MTKPTYVKCLAIATGSGSIRRAGRRFDTAVQFFALSFFDKMQLAALEAEPRLKVREDEVNPESVPVIGYGDEPEATEPPITTETPTTEAATPEPPDTTEVPTTEPPKTKAPAKSGQGKRSK